MRKIILASTSPRRREIFKILCVPFIIEAANYHEDMGLKMPPHKLAMHLAAGKAMSVAKRHKGAVVIGADTIVVLKNKILGKPKSAAQAKQMLKRLSGKVHAVITGFAVIDTRTKKTIAKYSKTMVHFKKVGEQEISAYVKTGEPFNKAGGYAIQGLGAVFIESIRGDYYNVVGLPLAALAEELKRFRVK